jgi:hypothetical protein
MLIFDEARIERMAEHMMTKLDHDYTHGLMTNFEYEEGVRNIEAWVKSEHEKRVSQ